MRIFRFLKTIPAEATAFAGASLFALLLKIFWFNRVSELFPYAYETGGLVESLLLSIVSGYLFYVVVNHTKDVKDRRIVAPFIVKQTRRVVGECTAQLNAFGKHVSSELQLKTVTESDVLAVFSKIAPYSNAPLVLGQAGIPANWFQFFEHHNKRTTDAIRRLLDHLIYVPPEITNLVASIEDSSHFNFLRMTSGYTTSNPDLSVWAQPFFEYCVLCKQLDEELSRYESRFAS